nr:hypothetical protein [Cupriavidus gilardii]
MKAHSKRAVVLALGVAALLLVGAGLAGWLQPAAQWPLLGSGVFCG